MKRLSKTPEEYLAAKGWSSELFLEHAKLVFAELRTSANIQVGRTVILISNDVWTIKAYVHHNGRTKEYVTLTDVKGNELQTLHCSCRPHELLHAIQLLLARTL